ncbi:hypothetical protein HPB50_016150 [Hyalomma asiaticum]|uniref:Uncharacterized protein n=1 Tax=Hyalomma asiaticum TaxID=266040 RepID=A0ACB7S1E8_HYAAI|nr:hypothetical protein HPB50_016150 [Hyalomma asiaticum]
MILRISATDARSLAADNRSRRIDDRKRAVETRRSELLTATVAHVYCCTKWCDASGRSDKYFYAIPADDRYLRIYYSVP